MILMKDIIREGNPVLRQKCVEVEIKDNKLSSVDDKIINDMIEYIVNSQDDELCEKYGLRPGVGLAAPQIGVSKKMLVILSYDEKGNVHFYPMINPKLISYSEEKTYLDCGEGCLSVDREVHGLVHRAKRVTVETYLYNQGELKKVRLRLNGYLAVIFQHEYDHLNGKLFVDHINPENPFFVPENSKPIVFNDEE